MHIYTKRAIELRGDFGLFNGTCMHVLAYQKMVQALFVCILDHFLYVSMSMYSVSVNANKSYC